jgi:hypothetical protein
MTQTSIGASMNSKKPVDHQRNSLISGLLRYVRRQVMPRWFSVITGSEFLIAAVVGVLFGLFVSSHGIGAARVGDVVTALLAYAAVAFGFSLAGLTIALTLPDENFAQELATVQKRDPKTKRQRFKRRLEPETDAYSDLLFIFSWTAAAHWFTVVGSFGLLTAYGFDRHLVPAHSTVGQRVAASLLAFITAYAICLFLVTLLTLSQVGGVYIRQLRNRGGSN